MNKFLKIVFIIIGIALFLIIVIPGTRKIVNEYIFQIRNIDEQTNYKNRKYVEDTARSIIINYNNYKDEYDTYKDFCNKEKEVKKCQRALDSKISANQSVQQYNEFVQKNRFIFKDNLPLDIPQVLEKVN